MGNPGSATENVFFFFLENTITLILKIGKLKICRGQQVGDGKRFWEMFTLVGCGGGGWGTTAAASILNTQQRFVYMQKCRGSIPATPLRS